MTIINCETLNFNRDNTIESHSLSQLKEILMNQCTEIVFKKNIKPKKLTIRSSELIEMHSDLKDCNVSLNQCLYVSLVDSSNKIKQKDCENIEIKSSE